MKEPTIEEKVAFLSQPTVYSNQTDHVLVKETHMSWVFLVGGFVYKMKKPVAYDFFDHRSLKSRYINCKEEVRINEVLAKDIYFGIVSLVINKQGELQLEGEGKAVEWLVKMKRIPEENMLNYAIEHNCVDEVKVRGAAILLTRYYQIAEPASFSSDHYVRKLEDEISENFLHLSPSWYTLPPDILKNIHEGLIAFLHANVSSFWERAIKNKIIDAHGDLRPEHVCLKPKPSIIDRLEFNKTLRLMDSADELSYLSVECDLLGNRDVGELFFVEYINHTNDFLHADLIQFYKTKKAFLRTYLVVRHMNEDRYKHDPQWPEKAKIYLSLAENYLHRLTL